MQEPPRPPEQRKIDALNRFENDKDLWVASADSNATPTLVALNFCWVGEGFLVATVPSNPTARNIVAHGKVRVVVGHTRDVVLMTAAAAELERENLPKEWHEKFIAKLRWDPFEDNFKFYRFTLVSVESWRTRKEQQADRFLMRNGEWLV